MTTNNVTTKTGLVRNVTVFSENNYVTPNEDDSEEAHQLKTIRMLLVVILIGIYASITITCNALALVILFQKVFIRNAFSIGQRVLTILDLILAITVLLKYVIKGSSALDFSSWNSMACRLYRTFYYTIVASINWTIVYLSLVRFVALKYPLKVNTQSFVRRAYMSLICVTTFVSLFFTLMYHEVSKVVDDHEHESNVEECFSYEDVPINEYVFRVAIMSVETIVPAILIVIVNTLTYREYRNVSIKRDQLKRAVIKHSQNISAIKRSLTTPKRSTFADLLRESPIMIAGVATSMVNYVPLVGSYIRAYVSANTPTDPPAAVDDPSISETPEDRADLLLKLKYERLHLRRATLAYETYLDSITESVPMNYRSRESSIAGFAESGDVQVYDVVQKDLLPPVDESTNQRRIISEIKSTLDASERLLKGSIDQPQTSKKLTPHTSFADNMLPTTIGELVDQVVNKTNCVGSLDENVMPDPKQASFIVCIGVDQEKQNLLSQLKTEKEHLRRSTIAYNLIYELDKTAIYRENRRRSSRGRHIEVFLRRLSNNTETHPIRYYEPFKITQVRCLLVLTAAVFLIQNSPYCAWYISGGLENGPMHDLIDEIVFIVQCLGHALDVPLYVFTSHKVKTEGRRLINHYRSQNLFK